MAPSRCVPAAGEIPLLSSFLYLLGEKEAEVGPFWACPLCF